MSTGESGPALPPNLIVDSIGGWRGMVDASLPTLVFIVVNATTGLRTAVWAAVAAGVAVFLLRLLRRQDVRQAASGFLGLAFAAWLAHRTGEARDFFLPGLLLNAGYCVLFLGSVLVGRPVVGYIAALLQQRPQAWRDDPRLRRVYAQLTLLWAFGVFLLRLAVQLPIYLADRTGWLATAKLAMGWPLTLLALLITVATVRRVHGEAETEPPEELDESAPPEVSASR